MNNQDNIIENFYSLNPIDYPNLARLSISQKYILPGDPPAIDIEMELSHKNLRQPQMLLLNFKGVTNFKFSQPLSSQLQVIQINVTSIKDWQWENARYKVTEVEDNVFTLMCKEFSARLKINTE
jgi:hypothetical protein